MVAAFRGSSSGMFFSTLPTRSAPTSAALVKMPPPTRMNMANMAAPNPKPSKMVGASPWNTNTTIAAPSRPNPTVAMPTWAPVRKAIFIAVSRPSLRAAEATRTLARVASHIPRNPISAENTAPARKATERAIRRVRLAYSSLACTGSKRRRKNAATAKTLSVRNCRPRYAPAPSCTARAITCILVVPSLAASTSRRKTIAITRASTAMTPTTATKVRLTLDKVIVVTSKGNGSAGIPTSSRISMRTRTVRRQPREV